MENQRLLESWKEIAGYLGRSVRTCRRWEADLNLPIHRLDGTPSARVFAYPEEIDRWLKEKLHCVEAAAREEASRGVRKKKWLIVGSAGLLALAVIAVLTWKLMSRAPASLPPHNPFLAVLPFDNPGNDASLEAWTTALPDLLVTDMRQSRLVNVIPFALVLRFLRELKSLDVRRFSSEDLKKIADKSQVDYTLTGSLARDGQTISVLVSLWDAKMSAAIKEIRVEAGSENRLFSMVDQLSRDIKLALSLTERQVGRDIDRKVSRISTRSPQAFKLFSQASRLYYAGDLQIAIPLLEEAVGLDPKFGLAYEGLYDACSDAERMDDMIKYARYAFDFADRISERERLLLLAGYHEYYESVGKRLAGREKARSIWNKLGPRDLPTALKVNERLWSLYPDFPEDTNGQLYLLDLYMELEDWDKAVLILEKLNLGGYKRPVMIQGIIECYRAMGLYGKAERILDDYVRANPDIQADMPRSERLGLALDQGKFDDALRYLEAKYPPGEVRNYDYYSQAGYIHWARDDLASSERSYRVIVDPDNSGEELQRLRNLEVLALSRGKVGQALDLAKSLMALTANLTKDTKEFEGLESRFRYDLAYLHRLSGHLTEALMEAEEACRNYEKRGIGATRELHLRALITLEMGRIEDFDRQAEEIRRFIEKESHPKYMKVYYHLLGCREMKTGNVAKAIPYFEKAREQVTPGRSFFMNIDAEPAKYFFSLAEAYELAGNTWEDMGRPRRAYENVSRPTVKGSFSGDLHARSFYRIAKNFDTYFQGPGSNRESYRAKIIENYRRFLGLWGDADPVFPEVKDARERLAALESK